MSRAKNMNLEPDGRARGKPRAKYLQRDKSVGRRSEAKGCISDTWRDAKSSKLVAGGLALSIAAIIGIIVLVAYVERSCRLGSSFKEKTIAFGKEHFPNVDLRDLRKINPGDISFDVIPKDSKFWSLFKAYRSNYSASWIGFSGMIPIVGAAVAGICMVGDGRELLKKTRGTETQPVMEDRARTSSE